MQPLSSSVSKPYYDPPPLTTPNNPFSFTPRTTFSTFQTAELRGGDGDLDDDISSQSSNESLSRQQNASPPTAISPKVTGSSILSSLVGDHMSTTKANKFVVPTMLPPNTLKRALMSRNQGSTQARMDDEGNMEALRREFGLERWKEYAVLRHGNSVSFQTSEHGRAMIESEVRTHEAVTTRCFAPRSTSAISDADNITSVNLALLTAGHPAERRRHEGSQGKDRRHQREDQGAKNEGRSGETCKERGAA